MELQVCSSPALPVTDFVHISRPRADGHTTLNGSAARNSNGWRAKSYSPRELMIDVLFLLRGRV